VPNSLVDLLASRAAENRESIVYSFAEGAAGPACLSYGALAGRAEAIAVRLREVAQPGDAALLLYPQGLDFIVAFWGCQLAGVVAVPMSPPRLNRADARLRAIAKDSAARVVLASPQLFARRERHCKYLPELGRLHWLDGSAAAAGCPPRREPHRPGNEALALLQYTSGSTGTPRGVMVSHANLLANLEDIDRGSPHDRASVIVSWLPFYHDMGLVYGLLMPVYKGCICHLMSPAFVLQNPLLWMAAISRHRATHSAAPNFAYELCARTITPGQSAGLDLSSWRAAGNGAEPIRRETLVRFAAAFRACGFDPRAFCPCYGLAEATLKVATIRCDQEPVYVRVDRQALKRHRFAPADPADAAAVTLVSCGGSEIGTEIRIVHPETLTSCAPDEVGEIWVAGPAVAGGYWRRPEETRETFGAHLADSGEGPFLRTGDLGLIHDGGLLVTGRRKDLLIVRGANHYPSDIETTVGQSHPALRPDAAAAFAVETADEERLVVVQEVRRSALRRLDVEAVAGAVCAAVALGHDLQVHALVLIRPLSLPKTSSGKIRRRACREDYLAGRFHAVGSWARRLPEAAAPPARAEEARPASASPGRSCAEIEAWLVATLAGQLGLRQEELDRAEPLARYGLGSNEAVRLSAALAAWLGRPVAPTLAYDHPTVAALAAHLSGQEERPDPPRAPSRLGEAIAVIGIGCRFPQADGPDAFWRLLVDGVDAISEVPPERWDAEAHHDPEGRQPGRMRTRHGGFIREVERFDAAFFGIAPHEAKRMDPQQRLLLEVAWEALEHAGVAADRLAGSATGVFVGVSGNDYARFQTAQLAQIDAYAGTGNALSLIANRLSYALDLQGPSLVVDTACSSSLVALHQACHSLRAGECDGALAGGVNLILTPHATIAFSQAGMMAADGRCKTFDAAADGYVRGEGCGLVVLKRLADAVAAGDRVLAVIRGSAVNHDGRSNGLTAPSRQAQERVIASALRQAGVTPDAIDYVEAHGTGTPLGDPIELGALKTILLAGRPAGRRCAVGSVKTNIGHLEAAAGIAGVIKTVLALDRELIPPHLHLARLSEQIDLAGTPLYVPTQVVPWSRNAVPRRAGVSSFGFGGTNAHLILEEAPPTAPAPAATAVERAWHVLALSAKSEAALRALARRYLALLDGPDAPLLPDLCWSANTGRAPLPHRAALTAASPAQLGLGLEALAADRGAQGLRRGRAPSARPKVAFLFTGQGSQYAGMGLHLHASQPVFRAALDRCEEILRQVAGFSLLALLGETDGLRETRYAQPALFALQHALAALWRSWGVRPDVVFGHSVGEYAAAHAAGILSLEDGLELLAGRGRLMQETAAPGAMAMVFADEARVRLAVAPHAGRVSIAALDGPQQVVVSGEAAAVASVLATLAADKIRAHGLAAGHGFHSPLMAPLAEPFARLLARCELAPSKLSLVADLSGEVVAPGGCLCADYWLRHLTEPVRFASGIRRLVADGIGVFLEIGPSGTLSALGRRSAGRDAALWLASLLPERPAEQTLLDALGALYTRGVAVDWRAFDLPFDRRRLTLPTYPFERQAHWFDAAAEAGRLADLPAVLAVPAAPARRAAILASLSAALGKLLELAPSAIDPETPLLELGADSIVFVGLVRGIEETYGIELPVRLFFEEVHSLSLLAAYLEERTTRDPPLVPVVPLVPAMPAMPAATSAPGSAGPLAASPDLGGLFRHQLDVVANLIEQQLAVLSGGAQTDRPATAPVPALARAAFAARAAEARPAFAVGSPAETKPNLTPPQRRYVEDLARRLYRRTPSSRQEADRHRARWADLRMTMGFRPETKEMCFPIVAERSSGAHVWDREGNRYVDLAMGFGVNLFGHNPPFVVAALRAQLDRGMHVGVQSDLAGEVASRIAAMTGMERVTFCNSGTEAVMTAIRLARAVTGRVRTVQFSGSYHGHADSTLAVARPGEDARLGADPMATGVPVATARQAIVLPYGEERALEVIAAQLPELAAVLVEPVQSRRPDLQPAGFLRRLRDLTRDAAVPLIFDEVITGFRVHPGGAQAWFGVEADLATYGKAIGGGMPIGIVAGRRRFLDAVDGGPWQYGDASRPEAVTSFVAGTFCKHPLAMAAALAVLRHLEAAGPSLQTELNARSAAFAAALNDDFRAAGVPIEVVVFSSLCRFLLAGNGSYLYQPLAMDLFFQAMVAHGVYIWEGRTCFLSTAHTDEDLQHIRLAARQSVAELLAAGFFAGSPAPRADLAPPFAAPFVPPPAAAPPATVPLSGAQRQLWMISQLAEGGSLAYITSIGLELTGTLAAGALDQALVATVARHEALRTVIAADGEHQVILPPAQGPHQAAGFQTIDLRRSPDPDAALHAWWIEQAGRPFDLTGKPLWRAHLLVLADDRHVLALAAHHLLIDGWSMGVVVRDLLELYGAAAATRTPAHLPAPLAWRDYLLWCDRQEQAPAMAEHEAYWLAQVAESRTDLDLRPDAPRPARKSFRGARVTGELARGRTQELRRLGVQHRCTPFMTLFALWSSYLGRRAAQSRITLGITTSGRPPHAETTVGYCSHLLPIGVQADAAEPFAHHLARTREALLGAYQHQDHPFSRLLEKLALAPDPSRTPLFAATFNLERAPRLPALPGLAIRPAPQPILATGFDLHLNVVDWDDRLHLELDFTTDLFTRWTAERLLAGFLGWLPAALAEPDAPLRRLPAMTVAERHQALVEWNDTAAATDSQSAINAIHDVIRHRAELSRRAPAVARGDTVLSYGELEERANQLAHHLIARGVTPGTPVILALPRGDLSLIVALLGILKAGAFYVPLDPALAEERLAFILADSAARLVVTCEAFARAPLAAGLRTVLVDADAAAIARQPAAPPNLPVGSQDAAYLLYTSGSTGRPKGVVVAHGPVVNLIQAQRRLFDVGPASRVLQFANLGFDASVSEIFVTLGAGATLVLAPPEDLLPGLPLVDLLRRERITLVTLPPAVASLLPAADLPCLATVVSAGEACTPEVVARWAAGHRLVNAYGPTETCVCATGVAWSACCLAALPIGRPLDNVRVYLLDAWGEPVPPGAVGEVHIGGSQVARGYWHDPAGTAARFLPDPAGAGERLYRTGDLAHHRTEGLVEYLGRSDRQVKVRGIRVELGEVEETLLRDPDVREALVVLREGRLVAYVVGRDERLTVAGIRDRLALALPAPMIPADFVLLAALPLNGNGKIDRDRLPAPDTALSRRRAAYVAPRTTIEETLAAIWQEVLGLQRVGIHDDFLSLGGHSLLSIQIAARIDETFAVRIPLQAVFSGETLDALARQVEAAIFAASSDLDLEAEILQLEGPSGDETANLQAEA